MSKTTKVNKAPPVEETLKVPATWDDQVGRIDLDTIDETRQVKFALLNAENSSYMNHIEAFQNYTYIHTTLDVKPIIFQEMLYIIKFYPVWDRPYAPPDIESYFEQCCFEARTCLKKLKPIPLKLMANLIKLRAIMLIHEDIYCETRVADRPSLDKVSLNVTPCSSEESLSAEEDEEESKMLPSAKGSLFDDAASFASELEYDRATMNTVYNFSSSLLQAYATALQQQLHKEFSPVQEQKVPRETKLLPWAIRYCKHKKGGKSEISDPTSKKGLPCLGKPSSKLLYMVLVGFYDVLLIKELHKVGIDLYCAIVFGGEEEDEINPRMSEFSFETWNNFINPIYYSTLQKKRKQKRGTCDNECMNLTESIMVMFWVKMEELCESNLSYTKNIIWFYYSNTEQTEGEREIGSEEYWRHGAKTLRFVSQYLYSVAYLGKFHRLYLRSLDVHELGETPEMVSVSKMFHYNESLRPIPPDCVKIGHVLEGLLDEVCHRVSNADSACVTNETCAQTEMTQTNEKKRRLLQHLLKTFKFAYMPVDPISFFHTHPHIIGMKNKIKIEREEFKTYDSNKLELETRYYPRLKNRLKSTVLGHLKNSFPALLWRTHKFENDFEVRMLSSRVYQTWLSFIRLTPHECHERLAIQMCNAVKCKERTKAYIFCGLHDYFVKPMWVTSTINAKQISKLTHKLTMSTPQRKDFMKSKRFPHDFHWQEHLPPEVLLQQTFEDYIYYDCFDHTYVPFLDRIIVRFHDPTDEFGAAVYIWEESIRSPVGLYNFFKHSIFEDSKWLRALEDVISNLNLFPRSLENASKKTQSGYSLANRESGKFEDVPFTLAPMLTFEDIFPNAPFVISNATLTAFDLEDRAGAGGTTTIFHSTEGLKVTVNVSRVFSVRTISLKVQGDGHVFVLHANPAAPFLFHFEAQNGTRIVFGKPEVVRTKRKEELVVKARKAPTEKRIYLIKELSHISFAERSKFVMKRYVNEKTLKSMLSNILAQTNRFSSVESLKDIESGQKIVVKSTTSLTDISKSSNRPPVLYEDVLKELRQTKKETLPHFRIMSSALHKRKYVVVSPEKIILNFADRSVPIKFRPNVNVSKRIEFSKCPKMDLPFQDVDPAKEFKTNYDIRITLPSGLQISTFPDPENPSKYLIVQSYAATGPMNASIEHEVSRTFTRQGYIRIKYRDGSIKMVGLNGRTVLGKAPCLNRKTQKRRSVVHTENLSYHKNAKLQKSIHKKVNRYQKRMIDKPGMKYLNQRLTKRDKYFKTLLDGFMNNPYLLDHSKLTVKQLLSPIVFKIQEDSFWNHYKNNFCTKDSFTSINDDGEQVTTFIDGTRISSWFKMEQEMIVIPLDPNVGQLELDVDDYTCNFLVPKTGAWIDVSLSIQFEHPRYATVAYKNDGAEVSILLPDNIEVRFKPDGTYFINLNDSMYSNVSTEEIRIRSNFCRKCYDSCETVMYVKHLYDNNEDVSPNNVLLEAKDNLNKYFKVEYCGLCHKNRDYKVGGKMSCVNHRSDTMEKFYSFDRSFRGTAYWTNPMLMSRILAVHDKNNKERVKYYLDEEQILRAYEITSYFINHYCDRFLMPYRKCDPLALKGFNPYPKSPYLGKIAYIKKRLVESLPNPETVVPLLNAINEWNVHRPWELQLPTKEMVTPPQKPKQYTISSTENINLRLPPHFAETAIERFRELNSISHNFKIGILEKVDSLTKPISRASDCKSIEMKEKDQGNHENLLKDIHKRYKHKSSSNRARLAWSYIDNSSKIPPVPTNSTCSEIPSKVSYGTLFRGKKDIPTQPSLKEFSSQPLPVQMTKPFSQFQENGSIIPNIQKPGTSIIPLLQPGVFEWRKANLSDSSSATTSERPIPIKKALKLKKHFKNKGTATVEPFDLLDSQQSHPKKCTRKVELIEPQDEPKKETSKFRKVASLYESQKGIKSWDNLNKLYKPVSNLKCCRVSSKKSFTETRKVKSSKECDTHTLSRELPLILKDPPTKNKNY